MARILIAGGGTVGLEVARVLERAKPALDVTLVEPDSTSVYQPLLPEVASGVIDPRHATIPLRRGLRRIRTIPGEVCAVDHDRHVVHAVRTNGRSVDVPFDHLVLAVGSITRVLPVPGLAERAIGFQTIAEALHLRDRVLERMHVAADTPDHDERTRALTVVVVGGGYSGVEVIGELESMARDACRAIPGLDPSDLRYVLVEATAEILPMVAPSLRRRAVEELEGRSVDVRLQTVVEAVDGSRVRLSDGTTLDADTIVWCAGARPHPVLEQLGVPLGDRGAVIVTPTLQIAGMHNAWSAGDGAAVPDVVGGGMCPPNAQFALRQARQLARNICAVLEGGEPQPFRYRQRGELVTLGRNRAVGEVFGVGMAGRLPWILRHAYHIGRTPTFSRKARLVLDWTVGMAFPREISELGSVTEPRQAFEHAARVAADRRG